MEYAYGANNIEGMSGIFTCTPQESPGYEYRETLDFGKLYTTKRTWIRIPKETKLDNTISAALSGSSDNGDNKESGSDHASPGAGKQQKYSFREMKSFADGHAVVYSMARVSFLV